jgi:hypothetical protein
MSQPSPAQYSTVQYSTVQYSTVQCSPPIKEIIGYEKPLQNSVLCGPECASARLSTRGSAHLNSGGDSCNRSACRRGGYE